MITSEKPELHTMNGKLSSGGGTSSKSSTSVPVDISNGTSYT